MSRLEEFLAASQKVHEAMPPTPQYAWPLLARRAGCEVWVKHENHSPIGAFKLRGGLVYMNALRQRLPEAQGVITATRGNHGQSVAYAAKRFGFSATVVVPHGNSSEKNAAMQAFGAELIEAGHDFQAAFEQAQAIAEARGLHFVESFHPQLVCGVGTYGLEFLSAVPDLDTVYVPIGLGSGICGMIAVRDALDSRTEVVGVCAEAAAAYALSYRAGKPVSTNSADTFADGMACRVPAAEAVEIINKGAARVVTVSDEEIKAAMRAFFTDTHNVAEGAGAAAFAALMQERNRLKGKKAGVVLSGGNIDRPVYQSVLAGA